MTVLLSRLTTSMPDLELHGSSSEGLIHNDNYSVTFTNTHAVLLSAATKIISACLVTSLNKCFLLNEGFQISHAHLRFPKKLPITSNPQDVKLVASQTIYNLAWYIYSCAIYSYTI